MERLAKAVAIAVVLFFVALGVVVGLKMDQNTIALLGGTTVGLLIATPCAAIATYVSMRRRDEHTYERGSRYQAPMPQNPPQYWVVPPQMQAQHQPAMPHMQPMQQQLAQPMAMAGYGMRPSTPEYMLPAAKRRFYVIGETGDVQEVDEGSSPTPTHNFDD